MKLIQQREMERIYLMIKSDDQSMRDLAISILNKKEIVRFSFLTIVAFHIICFLINLTATVYISYKFKINSYLIPLIVQSVLQLLLSTFYLVNLYDHRAKYNVTMKNLRE